MVSTPGIVGKEIRQATDIAGFIENALGNG
jgi:hypothetical protein